MRKLLWCMCFVLYSGLLGACTGKSDTSSYIIDPNATMQARWGVGDVITRGVSQEQDDQVLVVMNGELVFNRRFLGMTPDGYYLVQDFWGDDTAKKMTDPYILMKQDELEKKYYADCMGFYMIAFISNVSIQGRYTSWWADGETIMLKTQFKNGKLDGPLWFNDVFDDTNFEWEFKEGSLSGMCRELDKQNNVISEEDCSVLLSE